MAHLTPAETERIIQAHLETTGATAPSLMSAWRAMVFQMLERLELGEYRADCISLARDIVHLWGSMQPAHTYPPDHQFMFPTAEEVEKVRGLFIELNRLGMDVLGVLTALPPRTEDEYARDLEYVNEIANYVRACLSRLKDLEAQSGGALVVSVTAGELVAVLNRCMTLLSVVLGPEHTAAFKTQYDACIVTWDQAIQLMQAKTDGPLN